MPADVLQDLRAGLKATLAQVATAGGLFSIVNPEGVDIIVTDVYLRITTPSGGVATADVGVAANATTLSDNLIDGADINSAGVKAAGGTNGARGRNWPAGQYVTGSISSGVPGAVAGYAIVRYIRA